MAAAVESVSSRSARRLAPSASSAVPRHSHLTRVNHGQRLKLKPQESVRPYVLLGRAATCSIKTLQHRSVRLKAISREEEA